MTITGVRHVGLSVSDADRSAQCQNPLGRGRP